MATSTTESTHRLYLDDAQRLRFEAHVRRTAPTSEGEDGEAWVVLDRSAFYPESGGQMCDVGELAVDGGATLLVRDVQLRDGEVAHLVAGPAPAIDARVTGTVDRNRRRAHMALHTGQHILSRALLDVGNLDTVSSRLGETSCTIDLDNERIDEAMVAEAEKLACAIIDDDIQVETVFPDAGELSLMPLRKAPPKTSRIRIVRIGDFDVTPCGGTHTTSTAQVGLIKILGVERHKKKVRLQFTAGPRGRRILGESDQWLRDLSRKFSCGRDQVAQAIAKQEAAFVDLRRSSKQTALVAAELLATSLKDAPSPLILAIDGPPAIVREAVKSLCRNDDVVCLFAARHDDATHAIAARGAQASFDCGAFIKRVATAVGGRGGGRPDRAEAKLPAGVAWEELARTHLS